MNAEELDEPIDEAECAAFMARMLADEIEMLRMVVAEHGDCDCDFRYEINLEIVALEGARQYFEHKASDFGAVPEPRGRAN